MYDAVVACGSVKGDWLCLVKVCLRLKASAKQITEWRLTIVRGTLIRDTGTVPTFVYLHMYSTEYVVVFCPGAASDGQGNEDPFMGRHDRENRLARGKER